MANRIQEKMRVAIDMAKKGSQKGEFPVGCAIFDANTGNLLASAHNEIEQNGIRTNHAEMLAINRAGSVMHLETEMFITMRPCPMCAYAISLSRINRIYVGLDESKERGFFVDQFYNSAFINNRPEIYYGIMESECCILYKNFLSNIRKTEKESI